MEGSLLDPILRRAGAVMVPHNGCCVAAHFGSPAGELSVCARAVGLADRSELGKFEVRGEPCAVSELVHDLTGSRLASGGVLHERGAWWCAASPERVLVVCETHVHERLAATLSAAAAARRDLALEDGTDAVAALALMGPRTPRVLSALGAYGIDGDPRLAPPFGAVTIAGLPVLLLLASDHEALMLVDASLAPALWRAVDRAGQPFGLSCVGSEATDRFALLERGHGVAPATRGPALGGHVAA